MSKGTMEQLRLNDNSTPPVLQQPQRHRAPLRNALALTACAVGVAVLVTLGVTAQAPILTDHYIRYLIVDSDEDGTGVWLWSGFPNPETGGGAAGNIAIDEAGADGEILWVNNGNGVNDWELLYTSAATAEATVIASTGDANPATATITPDHRRYQEITCNDPDTCDVTMGETEVHEGMWVILTNLSTNTVDFADTAGVTELAGPFAMGQYDTLELTYAGDRWIEVGRSDN